MLTGKVMTAAFLLNGRPIKPSLVKSVTQVVQEMNKEEMSELKYYMEHGSFIHA